MLKKLFMFSTLLIGLLTIVRATDATTWYLEDFESLGILGPNKPEGWTISQTSGVAANNTFVPAIGKGVDGSNAFGVTITGTTDDYWFYTQLLTFGTQPIVEFQYKTAGVVGAAPNNCMGLELAVSANGTDWQTVKTVAATEFVSSSDYTLLRTVLPESYAGTSGYVRLKTIPVENSGTVNFYVDNFGVGTKAPIATKDLMIRGAISGSTMPSVNTETEYKFTIFNNGSDAQADYNVQLLNGTRSLLAEKNITENLEAGASAECTLNYTPSQTGADKLYAVVVLAGDENKHNDTAVLDIEVQNAGQTVIEVGKGQLLVGGQPFFFCSPTSIALALYSPEELNGLKGSINALMFEGKFTQQITAATQVYIGETDMEYIDVLSNERFIDPNTLTKVFDNNMTFAQGERQSIRFTFTQPYAYSGEKTLAVYTFSKIESANVQDDFNAGLFYCTSTMGGSTMAVATDGDNIDPMKPNKEGGSSPKFQRPNTKFVFTSVSNEKYKLSFEVKDTDGEAVSGAVITLNGERQQSGKYMFEDLPNRLYNYVVEKEGFIPARGSLRLNKDSTVAVTLVKMANYPGLSGFLFEDFENMSQGKRPLNWTGDFYVDEKGGKNNEHRLTHSFWHLDGQRTITTNPIFMGSEPVFELEYRVMDYKTYPENAFAGENMTWNIEVSADFGITWEPLYDYDGSHESSKEYKLFSVDVSDYAGNICQFKITVSRNNQVPDEFYFDIDNLKIGTQAAKDLAIVSKIEGMRVPGVGEKNTYTVCIRNEGSETAENYSLKFYDEQTEIGSVNGTKIESGAFAKLSLEHTFATEGKHTLRAVCVMENDEQTLNNAAPDLYVSAQTQGTKSSMVNAYEGEDMSWYAPIAMYDDYSLSWILYNKNDLAFETDNTIGGMAFRTKFAQTVNDIHLSLYVGETDNNSLFLGVPRPTSMTKVFDGKVNVSNQDGGNLVINFDKAYRYTGKNIVVAFYKEAPFCSMDIDFGFYGYTSLGAISVISLVSYEGPMDLSEMDLPTDNELLGFSKFCKPSTIFLLKDNVSYYSVNFEITDQDGNEVKNATITFDGTELAKGKYKVENVPNGTYAYTVKYRNETVNGNVTINGADVTEKVQFNQTGNEFNLTENMIRIYPNPTNDFLHIDVGEDIKEINLYDISGRAVQKLSRVPAGVIEMDLRDCHSGIYLLLIDGKAFKISKR